MATVIQFPVRLAHAITAHKIQGNTIVYPSTVLLDLTSVFEAAQAYVMLSRVQCIEQIFIYKNLPEEKIRTSAIGLDELKRLKTISMNENPTDWNRNSDGFRIAFVWFQPTSGWLNRETTALKPKQQAETTNPLPYTPHIC